MFLFGRVAAVEAEKKVLTHSADANYNLHQLRCAREFRAPVECRSVSAEGRQAPVHRIRPISLIAGLALAMTTAIAPSAQAIPALQLYCPDAIYDTVLDTWVINDTSFELWVVGDVGSVGTISDVYLAASMYGAAGGVSLTPAYTEVAAPAHLATTPGYDGLLNHDEYKNADGHMFWSLGNMTSTSSDIWDFGSSFDPLNMGPAQSTGTIFKISVHVTGWDWVHFDAFDHYVAENGASFKTFYVNAPNSHDATGGSDGGGGGEAPEPGSVWLLGAGLLGTVLLRRRQANQS